MPNRTELLRRIAAALIVAAAAHAQDVDRFAGKWQGLSIPSGAQQTSGFRQHQHFSSTARDSPV
jgi:hypothetical protein